MYRRVTLRLAKWQAPITPTGRVHEPPQIVQEVPPLNLWPYSGTRNGRMTVTATSGMPDSILREHADRRWAPIAEESDADRMEGAT